MNENSERWKCWRKWERKQSWDLEKILATTIDERDIAELKQLIASKKWCAARDSAKAFGRAVNRCGGDY